MIETKLNGRSSPPLKVVTGDLIAPKPATAAPSTALAPQQQQMLQQMQQMQNMQSAMLMNLATNLAGQVMQQINDLADLRVQLSEGGQYFCDDFDMTFTIEEF